MNDPLSLLEATVADWAASQEDIRGVVIVGSRARSVHPADDWSDLDLIAFSTTPEVYTESAAWLNAWGDVRALTLNPIHHGLWEWLVLLANGAKVDIVLAAADGSLAEMLARFPFQDVLSRGLRVLVDKTAPQGEAMPDFILAPPTPPTSAEFQNAVFGFLVAADKTARLLRRGDLWRAKMLCDGDLKTRLLGFVEWQAHATHGLDYDTWYEGRFLHEWAAPSVLSALPATFAIYDKDDLWRALRATVALFQRLATDSAARWGVDYPAQASNWIAAQLDEGSPVSAVSLQGPQEIRSSTQPR